MFIANHSIEVTVGGRYVVYWRVYVYVSVMQTVRDVLMEDRGWTRPGRDRTR